MQSHSLPAKGNSSYAAQILLPISTCDESDGERNRLVEHSWYKHTPSSTVVARIVRGQRRSEHTSKLSAWPGGGNTFALASSSLTISSDYPCAQVTSVSPAAHVQTAAMVGQASCAVGKIGVPESPLLGVSNYSSYAKHRLTSVRSSHGSSLLLRLLSVTVCRVVCHRGFVVSACGLLSGKGGQRVLQILLTLRAAPILHYAPQPFASAIANGRACFQAHYYRMCNCFRFRSARILERREQRQQQRIEVRWPSQNTKSGKETLVEYTSSPGTSAQQICCQQQHCPPVPPRRSAREPAYARGQTSWEPKWASRT